ncbi:MAG: DUF362 domain-containing protein [Candidatus Aminicenantes bacterium]|nr:DUF362 domain-containing protein [Candidatus Aminicenantes bacterium]
MISKVSIVKCTDTTVQTKVGQAMELAGWKNFIKPRSRVALKPNLGWDLFMPGSITSPWVVEGVIKTIQDYVEELFIVESDQVLENVEKSFLKSGINRLCQKYNVTWVNMSKNKYKMVRVKGGRIFKEIKIPEILLETDIITIPVMKTHNKSILSGAIKNQWGCIDKLRHNYHLVLDDALAEINSILKPKFSVVDATVCLEGNGPKSGIPKIMDLILASGDIVAVDAIQAKIMGFNPSTIDHLRTAHEKGLGEYLPANIETVGENINECLEAFIPAKHNLVSFIEMSLRKSSFKKLFFDTFLFLFALIGAKIWYYLWYYGLGKGLKRKKRILQKSRYGDQWIERKNSA